MDLAKTPRGGIAPCATCWFLLATALLLAGCGLAVTDGDELIRFVQAGPETPTVDLNEFLRAQVPTGPYRAGPGDLLSLQMPAVMRAVAEQLPSPDAMLAQMRRIRKDGVITLPVVGDVKVAGLTAMEIEERIETTYFPDHVNKRPSVVAQVAEYHAVPVAVEGEGVARPGMYYLRSDERSLAGALMRAGGIGRRGAESITVRPAGANGPGTPLVLPVRSGNIPLDDVVLKGGETIEVRPRGPQYITITGLIRAPGRYPYDLTAPPMLIEALAMAGGAREFEDPRYVSIYRRDASRKMLSARFRLNDGDWLGGASLLHDDGLGVGSFAMVKPGDVLVVERSTRSRTRTFIRNTVSLSVGASASASTSVTYHKDLRESGGGRYWGAGGDGGDQTYQPVDPNS